MKKLLSLLLVIAGVQLSATAQDGPPVMKTPEERAQRQTEMMTQRLGLTEAQRTRIYDINLKTAKQMQKFREAHDTANARAIRTASDDAYKKVLTAAQYQQYEELKQRRMERREGWRNKNQEGESREQ